MTDGAKTLKEYLLTENEVILVLRRPSPSSARPAISSGTAGIGGGSGASNVGGADAQIERLRQEIINNPVILARTSQTNPELASAAVNDPARFKELVTQVSGCAACFAVRTGDCAEPVTYYERTV